MLEIDWKALDRLRERFLSESSKPSEDYWESDELLAQYDATFAQRIAWKWRPVLQELKRKSPLQEPAPVLVDWACGTGVAAREFLSLFGNESVKSLLLYDRSPNAAHFAAARLKLIAGDLPTRVEHTNPPAPVPGAILLLSHLSTEMTTKMRKEIDRWISVASLVIWVEPGTPHSSRLLIELRESVRDKMNVVAPCPHQEVCGLLAPQNKRHWCHFFAEPPTEVFHQASWRKFSEQLKIDLRSLPVSYLVLSRSQKSPPQTPRVLGRVRVQKGLVKPLACSANGVTETQILNRKAPELTEQLKEGGFELYLP